MILTPKGVCQSHSQEKNAPRNKKIIKEWESGVDIRNQWKSRVKRAWEGALRDPGAVRDIVENRPLGTNRTLMKFIKLEKF